MSEVRVQKPLQVETMSAGKVELAKAKAKELSGRVRELLTRLKVDSEGKPRKVLKEIEKNSKIEDSLLSNKGAVATETKPKKSVNSVVKDSSETNQKPTKKIIYKNASKILVTPPPQISEEGKENVPPVSDNLVVKKKPFYERALLKIMSPERSSELLASWIMEGLEIYHEAVLNPGKPLNKSLFITRQPEDIPQLPKDQVTRWAVDHIGDIWEISAGFTAMRLGFVAANEVLKKIPAVKGYQIPDEACFWASLASTVTVKAAHSLGYISLFGIHDHMANPVPEMLFGQGVAAVVLAASHYAGKHHESVKALASRGITKLFS